jgi:hypothetical protein
MPPNDWGMVALRAFSGEVGTGSPQKMRPLKDNQSIFRRSGNRFAAENATTERQSEHFPTKWEGSPQKMRPLKDN